MPPRAKSRASRPSTAPGAASRPVATVTRPATASANETVAMRLARGGRCVETAREAGVEPNVVTSCVDSGGLNNDMDPSTTATHRTGQGQRYPGANRAKQLGRSEPLADRPQ